MNALQQYQRVNAQTSVVDADPHRLIQLLFRGALERINMARARIQAKDFEGKNRLINGTIDIVIGLRGFLDLEKGGDLADKLEALYYYIERTLVKANMQNDVTALDEAASLLGEIKDGWDGIRDEAMQLMQSQQEQQHA